LPAQVRSQVAPAAQLTEQLPVQLTWHVEPLAQLMLPLGPAVTAQVAELPHEMLHDWPQLPEQSLIAAQLSVQLLPLQPPLLKSQEVPAGQLQVEPVQLTGWRADDPQPANARERANANVSIFIGESFG
jgi:hypothetical protein